MNIIEICIFAFEFFYKNRFMMKTKILLAIILFSLSTVYSFGQPPTEKKFNTKNNIKTPTQKIDKETNSKVDSIKKAEKDKKTPEKINKPNAITQQPTLEFSVFREPSVVNEEKESLGKVDLQIAKITEETKINGVWVKAAEYYSVWNTEFINPYGINPKDFDKKIKLKLYDFEKGRLWTAPLTECLKTSPFGPRWGRYHHGTDINLRIGWHIYAPFDGIVRISAFHQGYGHYVVLRHYNGIETLYAHMSGRKVDVGQKVKAGQMIGFGGSTGWSTGPHLHFQTHYQGNTFNPEHIFNFNDPKNPQIRTQTLEIKPEFFAHFGNTRKSVTLYHNVVSGETLNDISKKYNVPIADIIELNELDFEEGSDLPAGMRLQIK